MYFILGIFFWSLVMIYFNHRKDPLPLWESNIIDHRFCSPDRRI